MVRLFGKRTRRYMLAYLALEKAKHNECGGTLSSPTNDKAMDLPEMSCALVEKIVKVYKQPHKAHRNIADSEKGFLKCAAKYMKSQN